MGVIHIVEVIQTVGLELMDTMERGSIPLRLRGQKQPAQTHVKPLDMREGSLKYI
jgi:hypothetical protein